MSMVRAEWKIDERVAGEAIILGGVERMWCNARDNRGMMEGSVEQLAAGPIAAKVTCKPCVLDIVHGEERESKTKRGETGGCAHD